jgi:hypothetical protein
VAAFAELGLADLLAGGHCRSQATAACGAVALSGGERHGRRGARAVRSGSGK